MNLTSHCPLTMDEVRDRVDRVFKFLVEVARRRSPVIHRWQEHLWKLAFSELPDHPDVARLQQTPDGQRIVLRVRRPKETSCPPPPSLLADWVLPGWPDVNENARHLATRNIEVVPDASKSDDPDALFHTTVTVAFEDDPERVNLFEAWNKQREKWQEAEKPVRRVSAVYQRLFELQGRLARESERLAMWVGDGLLRTDALGTFPIEYPLLVQRCELLFDSKAPAFDIRETSDPPELATPLLRELAVDGRILVKLRDKLAALDIDILDPEASHFLAEAAHALFPKCEVLQERPAKSPDHPVVFRDPVVFAAHRIGGMVTAIDSFLRRLHETGGIPRPLRDIIVSERIAIPEGSPSQAEDEDNQPPSAKPHIRDGDGAPPLLTKPANPEQEAVVTTLERDGAVVVQGPPGTGKTHTIANLLGHLLAQGKTVLVTSHTTKALRVLRDKVVEELRPLCVSVLDRDAESRQQLEESVKGIIQGLTISREEHVRHADQCSAARQRIWKKLQQAEQELRRSIRDQYDDIVIGGESISPVAAARRLNAEASFHAWLPGPIEQGHLCPLSSDEIRELYATTEQLTARDERDLTEQLPPIRRLPTPHNFSAALDNLAKLTHASKSYNPIFCQTPGSDTRLLSELIQTLPPAIKAIRQADKLSLECMNAGRLGGSRREPWDDLLETFHRLGDAIDSATALTVRFAPSVSSIWPLSRQRKVCSGIVAHLAKGRNLGMLRLFLKPSWKTFLAACSVRGTTPQSLDDFRAIAAHYQANADRDELRRRWQLQIEPLDGLPAAKLGDRPENTCRQFASRFRQSLSWSEEVWRDVQATIKAVGFDWDRVLAATPPRSEYCGDLLQIADASEHYLLPMLIARRAYIRAQELADKLKQLETILASTGSGRISRALSDAVCKRSASQYSTAWHELEYVYGRTAARLRREELLNRLGAAAPAWIEAIRHRLPPHDKNTPPGDAHRGWYILQLEQELHRRERLDPDQLQSECADLRDQLRQHTQRYVKHLAWAKQHDRTDRHVQSALKGWLQTVSRRGFHSGVMSARLKEEARKLLNQARGAVPVWIMPISRVVESYDFRVQQFDVVIVDEASQCDMTGLVALGLAKQAVVVGDEKQVSPVAVGQNLEGMQTLIDEYLQGVANAHLFTGRDSVYDMATRGFGKTIRLTEHFRCVPDIIQFSNQLSYDGEIKPLREFASVSTRPFVVAHRVAGGLREGKVNQREAVEIVSLILAAVEQPEYQNLTFGVISLLGDEQAVLVDSILQKRMPAVEYARRSLLCGAPPHFQGDERNIVFLSLVDCGANGTLNLNAANDDTKKRFNVAASRAQDQMWVIHSLNPGTDLKLGDFRLRLIQHAQDPQATERQIASEFARADSEFERQVIRRLSEAGYRIVSQCPVGAFRIDIVVIGPNNGRVAIECDGDRFHPPEKSDEDLTRQGILERVGKWRFIRIRGTTFFRNPEQTMQTVFRRLADLDIQPIGAAPAQAPANNGREELLERVKRRAEELRRSWVTEEQENETGEDEAQSEGAPFIAERPATHSVPDRLAHLLNYKVSQMSVTDVEHGILSCLREASRPLSRSEIMQRVVTDTNAWYFTIRKRN